MYFIGLKTEITIAGTLKIVTYYPISIHLRLI